NSGVLRTGNDRRAVRFCAPGPNAPGSDLERPHAADEAAQAASLLQAPGRRPPVSFSAAEFPYESPRIVVASSGLGHIARGVEAWAADLSAALLRRGWNVTLCKGGGKAVAAYERVIPCWQRGTSRAQRAARLLPRSVAWRLGLAST